jgi:Uma2 family endonuclease
MNKVAEAPEAGIVYPESDGQPMADNTKQFVWIVVLYGNLAAQYRDDDNVFVGGNQNWFPRQGEPDLVKAPDVYVVFGRPKGHRRSWKQWEENDVPLTVVFEVLSPKNTYFEMVDKLQFYDEYGVEEYYIYDPESNRLAVYIRGQAALRLISFKDQYISPRLGIRFDLTGPEMVVYHPDRRRFLTYEELEAERAREASLRQDAEQRADTAEQRADSAERRANSAEQRSGRLTELIRKVLLQQATPEETLELEQLLHPPRP